MYVYLRHEKTVKRLPEVTLKNCFKPKVGSFIETRIEPALWYKVLVIDSILVDCELRTVYVHYVKDGSSDAIHVCESEQLNADVVVGFFQKQEQIFTECAFYDFDPTVDELFDTAYKIFLHLSLDVFDKEGNAATYEDLLRMLHVFILPEIKFDIRHRQIVQDVLGRIEEQHEKIEDLIQKKDKTKRNTENSLSKQRNSLLIDEKFSSQKYVSSLDDKFLKIFLQHLEKDIRQLNEVLLTSDRCVAALRNSETEKELGKLESARAERNEVNSAIERAIVAREEIKNVISRKHVKKKFKKNVESMADFHELYVEVSKRLDQVNEEIRDLIISKIKISCVREAALLTVKEIDSDGISYGYNRKKGSFEIETDLFDPSRKPEEWATLTERVKTYLQVKQAGYRSMYEKFCAQIKRKCQHLYDQSKLFSLANPSVASPLSPEAMKFIDITGAEARRSRAPSRVMPQGSSSEANIKHAQLSIRGRSYSTRWSIGTIPKHECEAICKEISDHITDMAVKLGLEIRGGNEIPRSFMNKVYVCYEEHVSAELMPVLCELYEKSYQEQIDGLSAWLVRYSSIEISFQDKTIAGLFHWTPDSSEENSREVSSDLDDTCVKGPIDCPKTDTLGSMSLKNMTIEELYQKMNKQSEGMINSFAGALDMTYDDYLVIEGAEGGGVEVFSSAFSAELEHDNSVVINGQADEHEHDGLSTENGVGIQQDILHPPAYDEVVLRRSINATAICPRKHSRPPAYSTLPLQKEKFYKSFEEFFNLVKKEDEEITLFTKLRQMTHITKFIENQITTLRAANGVKSVTCTDDILDVIILLLCKLDAKWLLKLYAHLNLLIHLSPQFMQGNAHDYSLVNMSVAYQHLFEQQVLHKSAKGHF